MLETQWLPESILSIVETHNILIRQNLCFSLCFFLLLFFFPKKSRVQNSKLCSAFPNLLSRLHQSRLCRHHTVKQPTPSSKIRIQYPKPCSAFSDFPGFFHSILPIQVRLLHNPIAKTSAESFFTPISSHFIINPTQKNAIHMEPDI